MSSTGELATAIQAATAKCAKGEAQGAVRALAAALVAGGEAPDETTAEGLLLGFNERRWFDLAVELGQALAARGPMSNGMQRRYAQALIERGQLAAARAQLEPLARQKGIPASVRAEARGLIGRAHKQEFIDQLRATSKASAPKLKQAITAYLNEYEEDPPARDWHGINAVALLALAQRRGLSAAQIADPKTLAEQIVKNLQVKRERTRFDDATLAEAFVALGRYDEAAASLQTYVWHPDTSAFSLGSTLRQLEQIWELDAPGHPGQPLLTMLRARLVEVEQGAVMLPPGQVRAAHADNERAGRLAPGESIREGPLRHTRELPQRTRALPMRSAHRPRIVPRGRHGLSGARLRSVREAERRPGPDHQLPRHQSDRQRRGLSPG